MQATLPPTAKRAGKKVPNRQKGFKQLCPLPTLDYFMDSAVHEKMKPFKSTPTDKDLKKVDLFWEEGLFISITSATNSKLKLCLRN